MITLAKREMRAVFGGGFFKDLGATTQKVYQQAQKVMEEVGNSTEKIFSTVKTNVQDSITEFQEGREDARKSEREDL